MKTELTEQAIRDFMDDLLANDNNNRYYTPTWHAIIGAPQKPRDPKTGRYIKTK